jgi:hypothetical protein
VRFALDSFPRRATLQTFTQLNMSPVISTPKTTAEDCIWMLLISVGMGLFHHLLTHRRQNQKFFEVGSRRDSYFRSPTAFVVSWLPWLLFCIGNVVVSLLRDHGIMIFPWPIVINSTLLGVWLYFAQRIHRRLKSSSPPNHD